MWERYYKVAQWMRIDGISYYTVNYLDGRDARNKSFRSRKLAERSAARLYESEHGRFERALGLTSEDNSSGQD